MSMPVQGPGRSTGGGRAYYGAQDAKLSADPNGQLSLTPSVDGPIQLAKGGDGRYHAKVGGLDVAFTAEQMLRLDIKAGKNPVTASGNMDVPFKVNGEFMVPAGVEPPAKAAAKGFDSLPNVAGDKFVNGSERPAAMEPRQHVTNAKTDAAHTPVDASQALKGGTNWDSLGVPSPASAAADGAWGAKGAPTADIYTEGKAHGIDVKQADPAEWKSLMQSLRPEESVHLKDRNHATANAVDASSGSSNA